MTIHAPVFDTDQVFNDPTRPQILFPWPDPIRPDQIVIRLSPTRLRCNSTLPDRIRPENRNFFQGIIRSEDKSFLINTSEALAYIFF